MPERQYPFIDIAVHARVREHFARGDASVLFSKNVARVLWANDQGAKLFGTASVYDFIDTDLDPSDLSLRQLRATAAQLAAVGDRRQLLIRMASGFRRLPLNAAVEMILIGPGEEAILFTVPNNGKALSTEARAEAMIAGLDGPDTHMAVLDADGTVIAGSPGFESLGLSADIRRTLVAAAASDKDRLIKRPVATEKGRLPAAVGKISDHPALHLLFAVEAILEKSETEEAVGAAAQEQAIPAAPAAPVETREAVPSSAAPAETEQPAGRLEEAEPAPSPEAAAPAEHEASVGDGTDDEAQGELAPQDEDNAADLAEPETPLEAEPASGEPAADADRGGETADFAFAAGGRAVRFVWKIDAEGRFSEISEEFASAVGPKAADVIGVSFTDLADRYDLDPDDKINELLHRRDTWSGKTIFWPVQGTNLKVPVDLAALPTYSRSREFDGFRGFGIVRIADAVPDAKAAGLALDRPAQIAQDSSDMSSAGAGAPQAEAGSKTGPAAGSGKDAAEAAPDVSEDPFRGEQPALRVVETPGRQASDKVIDLDERRPAGAGALTRGEQAAFREIARQLGEHFAPDPLPQEGKAEGRHEADTSPSTPADTEESRQTEEAEAPGGRHDPTPAGETPAAAMEPGLTARNGAAMSSEILDRLPVALLVHHGDALLHANAEFLRLTGYENLEAFEQEGGLEALFALGNEAGAAKPNGTMTLVRKDGRLIPVGAHLHSIRWEGKSALMLALTPAGASEAEKQAREDEGAAEASRLRMEIDELRSILETATDGVVVLGRDGDIRTMNRSASALFDYDESDMRGKPFAALFAHESQKAVIDYLQGLSGHGVASVLNDGREVIGREAAGGFIPLFMTIGRLSSSNGYCAVIRDITQWKRTEEELRNAKRAAETANAHKTEFLARVSHEIRTPLNAIIGFSDMMASEHFGPIGHPRYIEYAGDIGRSGRHVLDIVNDLLDISKIEAGEMDLDFGAVDLNEAVSEAVSLVQPQANSQRVIIRTSLSGSVPEVVADDRSIKQIALNILANAIRFTPSGGQIVVSTSYEANGSVILRIRDTGIGMTRNELDQAMKPFRQVTTGGRKRGDGTGLGLPLTKAMAEANRAQFAITSAPNEGTLVEISFPSQRVLAN
ncbi:PAS domain S-box protein [Sinorhizobium meliloti WSM1022]|uniref:PAS domain S-box protein n=1 Tax=Rhizobium meliloti TaxID=382 RepID=UPI0004143E89|nr:PAS domain S-box protein [Sinorhizobium meliloti]ASQ04960.1 PAS domain-containing sensor histidine kinase [Sinorhizobium meliloti]MCO6421828.1 PAS domain S-box protein [Sinorhizobium meliloti]MDW9409890.1 PAS domain S-box protein [Sinorhizobium meliloti]MDW9440146.1 PAS domain S-box protein [Sinorhizobium meliloti]MDW9455265.1 PAS domain S-box protein [Sinorhizobium meliloti]